MKAGLRAAVWMGSAALAVAALAGEEWTPLFNGKDLEGWKATGGKWTVEDGCLLGQQDNGKVGDLWTTKEFDNFELRFTYKVVWPANSGIWYRGTSYQFDILKYKSPLAYSGSLYCPACRTTFIFVNLDESLENRDGWNEGRVYANGDHLIHWLNGKQVGECHDKTGAKGKIGIQIHGGDFGGGMKIFLKKIELRPLKEGDPPPKTPEAS